MSDVTRLLPSYPAGSLFSREQRLLRRQPPGRGAIDDSRTPLYDVETRSPYPFTPSRVLVMLRVLLVAFMIVMHHHLATIRAADDKSKGPSVEEQAAKLREDFKSTDPAVRRNAVSS